MHSRSAVNIRFLLWLLVVSLVLSAAASAQSYSGDARRIGMGGIGYSKNIATKMIEAERAYRSIILPLSLIQLFRDFDRFDPEDDRFDPVLAMEFAANPLHYVFRRDPGGSRGRFLHDLAELEFNRDLNAYRGFVPTNKLLAERLFSPNWGKTIKVYKRDDGTFHGFFVGAGPYISAKTLLNIDKGLTDVLASATPVSIPNRRFALTDGLMGQLALSVTGGYRARIAWPWRVGAPSREGLYIGVNYRHLRGFRYENADIVVRFDTDSAGLLAIRPTTAPVVVDYWYSRSGSGFAFDVGLAGVVDRWEFGFGANGVGNRIKWKDLTGKRYRERSLMAGNDFTEESLLPGPSSLKVELPVDYIGSGAYHLGPWNVVAEVARGFQGTNFHGGLERRLSRIELRGGGRYGLDRWHPAGGVGLNLVGRLWLDVAAFGSTTNIERELKPTLAVSLRINRLD